LLAEHFARGMTRELGREVFQGFTAAAIARLMAYLWPGNVRELKNVVERSLYRWPHPAAPINDIVFDAFGSPHHPAARTAAPPPAADEPAVLADFLARVAGFEKKLLAEALAANRFNRRRTAAMLGLTYDQLRHYLRKHGLNARR